MIKTNLFWVLARQLTNLYPLKKSYTHNYDTKRCMAWGQFDLEKPLAVVVARITDGPRDQHVAARLLYGHFDRYGHLKLEANCKYNTQMIHTISFDIN
jgi:hypothetical protein